MVDKGFTQYRLYFRHIPSDNLSKTSLPKLENACFTIRIYHEIKPNIIGFNILLTDIYIVGCVFAILICIIVGGHALLASRSNPKNKTTDLVHGTDVQQSVCIHMIAFSSRLLQNIVS